MQTTNESPFGLFKRSEADGDKWKSVRSNVEDRGLGDGRNHYRCCGHKKSVMMALLTEIVVSFLNILLPKSRRAERNPSGQGTGEGFEDVSFETTSSKSKVTGSI